MQFKSISIGGAFERFSFVTSTFDVPCPKRQPFRPLVYASGREWKPQSSPDRCNKQKRDWNRTKWNFQPQLKCSIVQTEWMRIDAVIGIERRHFGVGTIRLFYIKDPLIGTFDVFRILLSMDAYKEETEVIIAMGHARAELCAVAQLRCKIGVTYSDTVHSTLCRY